MRCCRQPLLLICSLVPVSPDTPYATALVFPFCYQRMFRAQIACVEQVTG
jgi:hypothetical protein